MSENTFVCLVAVDDDNVATVDVGGPKTVVAEDGEVLGVASFSFSFSRPLRALKNP
jgi:hypothetical protein